MISDEAVEHLRLLLAEHYVDGTLPPPLVQEIEAVLKSLGQWFPDPQLRYEAEPN